MPTQITLAQIEFPVHALSEHHMKVKRVKNRLFQNAVILYKNYFLAIKYLHAYVQCLYIVYAKHQLSEVDQCIGLLYGIRYSTAKEPYCQTPTKQAINSRFNFSQFPNAIILNGLAVTLIIYQATLKQTMNRPFFPDSHPLYCRVLLRDF